MDEVVDDRRLGGGGKHHEGPIHAPNLVTAEAMPPFSACGFRSRWAARSTPDVPASRS